MTAKQIAMKKYVVKLSDEERARLNTLIHTGKHPAWQITKARILLKADASEAVKSLATVTPFSPPKMTPCWTSFGCAGCARGCFKRWVSGPPE